MTGILLDTHGLIWLLLDNKKIGKKSSELITAALKEDKLYISSISIWEVAMLVKRERLKISQPLSHWYKYILSIGIKEIPLFGDIAIETVQLEDFHPDPADRIIVATAIAKGFTLLTADSKILNWQGMLKSQNIEK